MGYSTRAFKVTPNGELQRFSYARFRRLYAQDPLEALLEHAGGHADFAIVSVRTDEGQPVQVQNLDLIRLHLDPSGRFSEAEYLRRLEGAGRLLEAWRLDYSRRPDSSRIVPAANRFARKQHDREFAWEPSEAQWGTLLRFIDTWPQREPRG